MSRRFLCLLDECRHGDACEAVLHGQHQIAAELRTIRHHLASIGQAINLEREAMTDFHGELDAALQGLTDQIGAVDADLSRELADFASQVSPKLSDDERTQLGALAQKLTDFQSSIDAADPQAPPPAGGRSGR